MPIIIVTTTIRYCAASCTMEYILFWLDAEQFRHFDGAAVDVRMYAGNILRKFVRTKKIERERERKRKLELLLL